MLDYDYKIDPLTRRELEVLQRLWETGATNRAIGDMLCITEATVEQHLYRIYQKLGVSTRMEAVIKALNLGLVDLEQ